MTVKNDSSGTHMANATMAANSFEQRVSQGTKEHTGQEGQNAGTKANQHEQRATQEQGSH